MGTFCAERHTVVVTRQAELDKQPLFSWADQTAMHHETLWLEIGNSDALKLAP